MVLILDWLYGRNGAGGDDMGDFDRKELFLALFWMCVSKLLGVHWARGFVTYSAQLSDLFGELVTLVVGNAFKVEDHLVKARSHRALPYTEVFEFLCRDAVGSRGGGVGGGG